MLSQSPEILSYQGFHAADAVSFSRESAIRLSPVEAGKLPAWVWYVLMVIFFSATAVFLSGLIAQENYEMQILRAQSITLEKQNETARLEISLLEAPQRIQSIAETKLGMVVPHYAVYGMTAMGQHSTGHIRD